MDKVHTYIDGCLGTYRCATIEDLLSYYRSLHGFTWIDDYGKDDGDNLIEFPELLMRSAFEFIHPELTGSDLAILDIIDASYKKWIEAGIFYDAYSYASGGRFTWERHRSFIEDAFGRSIPKSHWWLWPPEEV